MNSIFKYIYVYIYTYWPYTWRNKYYYLVRVFCLEKNCQKTLSPVPNRDDEDTETTTLYFQLPQQTVADFRCQLRPPLPPQYFLLPLIPISSIWPPFCEPFARDGVSFSRVGGSDLLWLNFRPCSPSAFRRRLVPCARSPLVAEVGWGKGGKWVRFSICRSKSQLLTTVEKCVNLRPPNVEPPNDASMV